VDSFPKTFSAQEVESKWYPFWEKAGYFSADAKSKKEPYCMVMPPPNITGVLHMGHALVSSIQDILIRWKRMLGFEALWIPGIDHAGIATQTVVEKHLIKTTGKRRKDFSREEFLSHVWEWKEKNGSSIKNQLKKLGSSCDWSRSRFTMDEELCVSVRHMFKKMFDDGLIYRGDYLVNWDPVTQTALADDEVEYEDKEGFLWYFHYPIKGSSESITIATTRPETMLGDTAIAVNPKDPRYSALIGNVVVLPLVGREIPIIGDPFVELEFGTGAVKITPAHDPNDYEMGIKYKLPFINILTPDGLINENGGIYEGLTKEEARERIVLEIKELGLLEKVEPYSHRVGVSYRSKAVIEPYLSKQWFVNVSKFAPKLRKAVEEKKLRLIPENWNQTYFHWIDNLRDWCISRQLWWGHRIPIWYHVEDSERLICYAGEGIPSEVEANPELWRQDEDVLDTWFSSALWPFSTLGWPEKTLDLSKFYPNSILVTGHDILFFWVARMALMGEYALGTLPFPETFLHGLIYGKSYWRKSYGESITYISEEERRQYDLGQVPVPSEVGSKWEKMSKSKGNILNPLEVIEEYGTDAIRMALCVSGPQSREIDLDRRRFEDFKHFSNKIWNGARFIFMNLEGEDPLTGDEFSKGLDRALFTLQDQWIISTLTRTTLEVNKALENYEFDQAALKAYDFFWKEFCAYYVEISKPILFGKTGSSTVRKNTQKLLVIILCSTLRLLHPIVPFITEELFQRLKEKMGVLKLIEGVDALTLECITALNMDACIISPYPKGDLVKVDHTVLDNFSWIHEIVYSIRNIRGEMKIPPQHHTEVCFILDDSDHKKKLLEGQFSLINALVKCKSFTFLPVSPQNSFGATGVIGSLKIFIPLPEELKEQELKRLSKEKERLETSIEKFKKQLNNPKFTERAPKHLVDEQKQQFNKAKVELEEITNKLGLF
jgi:valyl-tRNA synthetase